MGLTALSITSITLLAFSSMVVVRRYWPLVKVVIQMSIMKPIGRSVLVRRLSSDSAPSAERRRTLVCGDSSSALSDV